MRNRTMEAGLQVAGALLLHRGEVSVEDIKAIPFFENREEVEFAIKTLQRTFNATKYTKKIAALPIPQWEEVIQIDNKWRE